MRCKYIGAYDGSPFFLYTSIVFESGFFFTFLRFSEPCFLLHGSLGCMCNTEQNG